jgi:hypothetical protein
MKKGKHSKQGSTISKKCIRVTLGAQTMSKNSTQKMFKPLKLSGISKDKVDTSMGDRRGENKTKQDLPVNTD